MDPPTAEDLGITPQQFGILQKVSKVEIKFAYLQNTLEILMYMYSENQTQHIFCFPV